MSFAARAVEMRESVALVWIEPTPEDDEVEAVLQVWSSLQTDSAVRAVAVLSRAEHFSFSIPTEESLPGPRLIGPKAAGLLKPFGVGLRGKVFDFGLQLLADADVSIATVDVLLADTSSDRGHLAQHAALLRGLLPVGEVSRLALLGARGAINAHRSVALGLVDAIVDVGDVESVIINRLRALSGF
jgi:hypothetical protein